MYFVIYQETENVYEPPYSSHEKGEYRPRSVDKYAFCETLEQLFHYSKKTKVKYFKVEQELKPTFKQQIVVTL